MTTDAAAPLLLACLHHDRRAIDSIAWPADESSSWGALADLAAKQRVRPLVHRRLKALAATHHVPDRVLQTLEQATQHTALRNLRFLGEAAAIARALSAQRVPLLVLKGVHLAATAYDSTSLREMSDIDVLVRREHLQAVVDAVVARGYRPLHGTAIDVGSSVGHHLARLVKPNAAGIEIHWNLTPAGDPHAIDSAAVWTRAVPVTIAGVEVLGLCREDLLLHLCYHAAYLHQFRFGVRPFCDLAALLAREREGIDWQALVARARSWRWDRGTYLALRLAHELVGAGVSADVLAQLRPAAFDETVTAAAKAHVLSESSGGAISPGVSRLAGRERALTRLGHLWTRVLPPREEIARVYGHRASSAWLPWLYVHRAASLARQHAPSAIRLMAGRDSLLAADASRAGLLREWLDL